MSFLHSLLLGIAAPILAIAAFFNPAHPAQQTAAVVAAANTPAPQATVAATAATTTVSTTPTPQPTIIEKTTILTVPSTKYVTHDELTSQLNQLRQQFASVTPTPTTFTSPNIAGNGNGVYYGATPAPVTTINSSSIKVSLAANDIPDLSGSYLSIGGGSLTGSLGVGTTSPGSLLSLGGIANFTTATSTFYANGGINLAGGCFAVNGICVSGVGGGVSVSAANTWTALQQFISASSTLLSVYGPAYFGGIATSSFNSSGVLSLVSNGLSVGTNQLVITGNKVGIGTNSPSYLLDVASSTSATTGATNYASRVLLTSTPASITGGANYIGLYGASLYLGTAINNAGGGVIGIRAEGSIGGTSSASTTMGVDGVATFSSTNTTGSNSLYGGRFLSQNTSTGLVGHAIGIKVLTPINSGGGTITDAYGVYIANQSGVAGVSSALHIEGAGTNNAITFAGDGSQNMNSKIYSPSANVLNIDATSNLILQSGSGAIGLGTSSPNASAKVTIQATSVPVATIAGGTTPGVIHINPVGGDNGVYGITFGANNGSTYNYNAQAGLYVQSSGSFGTKLSLATSNNFGNGAQVRLLVDQAGNVGIGTTTPYAKLSVWGSDSASSTAAFNVVNSASSTVFAVFDGGNAQLSGTLTQSSDQRLKKDIASLDASSSLTAIKQLNPVMYNWIDPEKMGSIQYGFIAQDMQKVFPNLVSVSPATPLTPDGTLGINYIGILAPLVKAVQVLADEVQTLSNTVAGFALNIVSAHVTATIGDFDQVNTKKLCAVKSDGTSVCVTGDQLANVLAAQGGSQSSTPAPQTSQDQNNQQSATSTGSSDTNTDTSTTTEQASSDTTTSSSTPQTDTPADTATSTEGL